MRRLLPFLFFLAAIFGLAGQAAAHTKSETHTVWRIVDNTVHLSFNIPKTEARRLDATLPDGAADPVLGAYLAKNVSVKSEGGACTAKPPQAVAATIDFRRFELTFTCPSKDGIVLHSSAFFDLAAQHVTFAQITLPSGRFVAQLLTKDHQEIDTADAGASPLQSASFFEYIRMGMMHIFTGIDHMAFIVGFIIIARRMRDLLFVVTGFTIGHSITLALAVTGLFRPHAEYIDALIGLTIALVGAENVALSSGKPTTVAITVIGLLGLMALVKGAGAAAMYIGGHAGSLELATLGREIGGTGLPALLLLGGGLFTANYLMISGHLRDAARVRLVVTLVFGLIHGFGFAANLLDEKLPKGRLAKLLVGFNVGVEIGQISVVFVVTGLVLVLRKLRMALPRPIVIDVVSAGLVAFGLFLFVSRGYAT